MATKPPLLALAILLLAGCATPVHVRVPISGGQRLTLDAKSGTVVGAKNPVVKVQAGGLMVDPKEKQATYMFALEFKPGDTPVRVQVEDVSDRVANVLVDDRDPKLVERLWAWKSATVGPDERSLAWVHEIDDSFRIFRFTVVMADGGESVQYKSVYYPGFMKGRLRIQLGLES